jgi:tuberculosinol/isotuberculosinol synthase
MTQFPSVCQVNSYRTDNISSNGVLRAQQLFQESSAADIAKLLPSQLTCVIPINGTRRYHALENNGKSYLETMMEEHVRLWRLCFEHGITAVLSPMVGADIMAREKDYVDMMILGFHMALDNEHLHRFLTEERINLRFYGDYERHLAGTPYASLLDVIEHMETRYQSASGPRLYIGLFAGTVYEQIARLSVEFHSIHGRVPTNDELIQLYYGYPLAPARIFIGFGPLASYDYPLLNDGHTDLYFLHAPTPYMDTTQLRSILFDHLYIRSRPEPSYDEWSPADKNYVRHYYHSNQDHIIGVGQLVGGVWCPVHPHQTANRPI